MNRNIKMNDNIFKIKLNIFRFIQLLFRAYLKYPPNIVRYTLRYGKTFIPKYSTYSDITFFGVYKENLRKYGDPYIKGVFDIELVETTKEGYINYVRSQFI